MFDKLIESNSAAAEFKPRRKFFMVSSVVVGIVFLSAVVASLYAQELNLGTENFELSSIVAPVTDAPQPQPPRQREQQPDRSDSQRTELPSRPELIARIDQTQEAPTEISTVPNRVPPIPLGAFRLNPDGPSTDGNSLGLSRGTGEPGTSSCGSSCAEASTVSETVKLPEPPPTIVKKTEAPKRQVTKGVINGTATSLPKPPYPPLAKQMGVSGDVNVQVLINEHGDVVSAKAVNGHAMLRSEAEKAAQKAKFKPTLLSGEPVKVTGIIVYRFAK